jgi:hypothetical protein
MLQVCGIGMENDQPKTFIFIVWAKDVEIGLGLVWLNGLTAGTGELKDKMNGMEKQWK